MTVAHFLYVLIAVILIGLLALSSEERRDELLTLTSLRRKDLKISSDNSSPWALTAPRVTATNIPSWLRDYIEFHSKALQSPDQHQYLIYTCTRGYHCSGTGNRQRGIAATFLVAILTRRIFLMDINNPVPLQEVLTPHLIQWNASPPTSLASEFVDIRNRQPNPLQDPAAFVQMHSSPVIRVLANGPGGLETIYKSPEMLKLLDQNHHKGLPTAIYKQLFYTLFRPSFALTRSVQRQRTELNISDMSVPYICVHVRLGGGGAWHGTREERYNVSALPQFLEMAHQVQQDLQQDMPLVVVSDDVRAKMALKAMDENVRIVTSTKIVHVDRSSEEVNDIEGSLSVWADILVMAQATCLVESLSSFSSLARRISMPDDRKQNRCSVRQGEGMLLNWTKYW